MLPTSEIWDQQQINKPDLIARIFPKYIFEIKYWMGIHKRLKIIWREQLFDEGNKPQVLEFSLSGDTL